MTALRVMETSVAFMLSIVVVGDMRIDAQLLSKLKLSPNVTIAVHDLKSLIGDGVSDLCFCIVFNR
jgi:hypothetical protein